MSIQRTKIASAVGAVAVALGIMTAFTGQASAATGEAAESGQSHEWTWIAAPDVDLLWVGTWD